MEITKYTDTDTVSRMMAIQMMLADKFRPINQERYRNFNMLVSSLQWDEKTKRKLESEDRPANAYNLISPIIKYVTGLERSGRKKLQVIGRTSDDHYKAEMFNKVLDWMLSVNNWDYQKSRAVLDAIIGRWGVIYNNWSWEDDPLGRMKVKRYNPFRLMFDMDFTDTSMKDCQYIYDVAWYTIDEIITTFALTDLDLEEELQTKADQYFVQEPNAKKKNFVSTMLSRLYGSVGYFLTGKYKDAYNPSIMNDQNMYFDSTTGRFMVIEGHERRTERIWKLYDPVSNQKYDITKIISTQDSRGYDNAKLQLIRGAFPRPDLLQVSRGLEKKMWVTSVIPGFDMKVQDVAYKVQNGNFMHTLVFAYDFHADLMQTQSLVDELIDPQSDYNKRRSTILEILVRTQSLGWTVEAGAIDGFENEWLNRKIGSYKRVNRGFFGKVQEDQPLRIPPELLQDTQESKLLTEEISGVSKASKGMQESKQETGKLFLAKKEQSDQMLAYLFDNIDNASMIVGKNVIDYVQVYMKQEREIRLTEDADNPEFLKVNQRMFDGSVLNDLSVGEYDVDISQSPYGKTAREVEYLKLVDMMQFIVQINPQAAMLILPVLIKASDSPYRGEILTILEKINGMTEQDLKMGALTKLIEAIKGGQALKQAEMSMQQSQFQIEDAQKERNVDDFLQNLVTQSLGISD